MTYQPEPDRHVALDQSVHPDADWWGGWGWSEPMRGEHFRRCNFCGSLHPEDFANEPGVDRIDWSDPKYGWPHKAYVDIVNRDPERLYVYTASNAPQPGTVAREDLTDEQWEIITRDGWDGRPGVPPWKYFGFDTRRTHNAKFYSIHLKDSTVSPEVKRAVEERIGLRFEFLPEGRVRWERVTP